MHPSPDSSARPTGRANTARVLAALVIAIALATSTMLAAGCCASPVSLTREEAPTTAKQLEQVASAVELGRVASVAVEDAPKTREAVLAGLRTQGDDGSRAAEMLTRGFPEDFRAVPILLRLQKVDGTEALVVVEAYGSAQGKLDRRRLWVFDWKTGTVIRSTLVD